MKRLLGLPLIERLRLLSLILTTLALAVGYILDGHWPWVFVFLVLGVAGWWLPKFLDRPPGSLLFTLFVTAAALGALSGIPALAMLIATVSSLAFWDLDAFQERRKRFPASEDTRVLERYHLRRLAWVLGLGLALSLPGLLLHIKINLLWAMLLSLLAVFGIRWGIASLRQSQ